LPQIGGVVGAASGARHTILQVGVGGAHVRGTTVLLAHPTALLTGVRLARPTVPFRSAGRAAGVARVQALVGGLTAGTLGAVAVLAAETAVAIKLRHHGGAGGHWHHIWRIGGGPSGHRCHILRVCGYENDQQNR